MDYIVNISKIFGEYRRLFNEGDVELSFNEVLILEAVFKTDGKAISVAEFLSKDKGYIHRLLKMLRNKDLIIYEGNAYLLTGYGRRTLTSSKELFNDINSLLRDRPKFIYEDRGRFI